MSTTPQQTPQQTPARSAAARPVMIATSIFGGFALLAVATSAALASVGPALNYDGELYTSSLQVSNLAEVEIEAAAASITIAYGDVPAATLEIEGPSRLQWTFDSDGNNRGLRVASPRGVLGFGLCFFGCNRVGDRATLTLPREFEDRGVNIDASFGAGKLTVDGRFGDVDLEMSAGNATLNGSARSIGVEMSAGDFNGKIADAREVSFSVSAGSAIAELTGDTPREVEVELSAGSVDLLLPNDKYRVNSEATAGSINNKLRTDAGSLNVVTAEVSAGKVTLRPAAR